VIILIATVYFFTGLSYIISDLLGILYSDWQTNTNAIFSIIIGGGLFFTKNWARLLCIAFDSLHLIVGVYSLFGMLLLLTSPEFLERKIFGIITQLILMLMSGMLVYYFTRPKVKEHFKEH